MARTVLMTDMSRGEDKERPKNPVYSVRKLTSYAELYQHFALTI